MCGQWAQGLVIESPSLSILLKHKLQEDREGLVCSKHSIKTCCRSLDLREAWSGKESKQKQVCKVPGHLEAACVLVGPLLWMLDTEDKCTETLRPMEWKVEGSTMRNLQMAALSDILEKGFLLFALSSLGSKGLST